MTLPPFLIVQLIPLPTVFLASTKPAFKNLPIGAANFKPAITANSRGSIAHFKIAKASFPALAVTLVPPDKIPPMISKQHYLQNNILQYGYRFQSFPIDIPILVLYYLTLKLY